MVPLLLHEGWTTRPFSVISRSSAIANRSLQTQQEAVADETSIRSPKWGEGTSLCKYISLKRKIP